MSEQTLEVAIAAARRYANRHGIPCVKMAHRPISLPDPIVVHFDFGSRLDQRPAITWEYAEGPKVAETESGATMLKAK